MTTINGGMDLRHGSCFFYLRSFVNTKDNLLLFSEFSFVC